MVYMGDKMATWVRIVCAVALLCLGFAHKAPAVAGSPIPVAGFSQYVLPDGTMPVLCLSDGHAGHDDHQDLGKACEACRLGSLVLLPAPADTVGVPILPPPDPLALAGTGTFHRPILPSNASPRGPPSGQIA